MSNLESRFNRARDLVVEAGAIALGHFRSPSLVIEQKGLQDLVTVADREVEAFLIDGLSQAFPQDAFVGEESGNRGNFRDAPAVWVIDPIDGTSNFARGIDLWCVSVGLVVGGEVVAGLVYHPPGDELFSAFQGEGAFLNGRPIHVSSTKSLDQARIDLGFSFRRPPRLYVEVVARLLGIETEHARLGSAALGMAYVAAGRYDGYWEAHVNSWDVAGGIGLVTEAGGRTNAFLGGTGLTEGNAILASNPQLYPQLKALLDDVGAGSTLVG